MVLVHFYGMRRMVVQPRETGSVLTSLISLSKPDRVLVYFYGMRKLVGRQVSLNAAHKFMQTDQGSYCTSTVCASRSVKTVLDN